MNSDTTPDLHLTSGHVEAAERTATTIQREPEYSQGIEAEIYEWHLKDVLNERRQRGDEGRVGDVLH